MRTTTYSSLIVTLCLFLSTGVPASAQDPNFQDPNKWAIDMFDSTSHDFGVVAKGAEVKHSFKVTNKYKQDVRISNVTTSCGCTSPQFSQQPVPSGQSTYIDISMDTNRFQHLKTSNVTVTFDQPIWGTVVIPVKVWIRTDVVLTPGAINFGEVDQGQSPIRKLQIAYAFNAVAGIPNWTINNVAVNNAYLKAQAVQTSRGNGLVEYDLNVSLLPNAPVGKLRQQIELQTNDPVNPKIPVMVQAQIDADVTVAPSVVQLGSVAPGVELTKTVVLRGIKPFAIEKIECESNRQAFKMPPLNKDAKTLHVLPLTFTAPKDAGFFSEKFIVTIKDRPQPIVFNARGTIETAQQTSLPR